MLFQLFQTSGICAGFLAVIWLIGRLGGRRVPPGCMNILWLIALIRLFLPLDLPSRLSAYQLLRPAARPVHFQDTLSHPAMLTASPLSLSDILTGIWAIGLALCIAHLALSYLRLHALCRAATPVSDPAIRRAVQETGLWRTVQVRVHSAVSVPCTFGILRPTILLPTDMDLTDDALRYILSHELAHIRRLDCLRKLLFQVARCIHWFNPMVWLLWRAAGRDLERACDLSVLRTLPGDQRAAYAHALVRMAARPHNPSPLYSAFGKSDLEERIVTIMTFQKRSLVSIALTLAIAAITTTAFATNLPASDSSVPSSSATDTASASKAPASAAGDGNGQSLQRVHPITAATSSAAGDGVMSISISATNEPADVQLAGLDVVSQETLDDGSLLFHLADGSTVTIAQENAA